MNSKLKILVLEDNDDDAEILMAMLKKEFPDIQLFHALNKDEFANALSQFKPDVILGDNSLPQFSATEALTTLSGLSLRIPFILVTGTVSEEFAAGIIKLGAFDYILKDRLVRLPSAIIAALANARMQNERFEAYSKLIESEERYRTLIERVTDAFISVDSAWNYTYVNRQAGILIHRDPKLLIGKNMWTEFPDAIDSDTYKAFHRSMSTQEYVANIDYYQPLKLWQENHIYPSDNGLSVFIRDISKRKKAEDEMLQMNKDLRELSSHLQDVREQERIHIAREIHDELGQQLSGLKMEILWLQNRLQSIDETVKHKITDAANLIDDTVKTVRRIVADLRPAILDDLGLVAALRWHGEQVQGRTEIEVNFTSIITEFKIPIDIATGIFRIYQEVLTNSVKHADAKHITSSLQYKNSCLHLVINDDGKGMDQSSNTVKSFGILGIKERTFIMGGTFEIHSHPGKGTTVHVTIPYKNI